MDHNKLWKILTEMGILDHCACLLRNQYAGKEATVRTRMEQETGSKLGKECVKAVYYHPATLNITQNTRLEKAQAGIKIARKNTNNLRYTDDITLMAESKEELKSLLIMVKEEIEKASLKPYSKNEDYGIRFITDCQKWGKMETVTDFILFSFTITVDADCSHEIKRLLGRKAMKTLTAW